MTKVISKWETIYKWEELSDEAKQELVDNYIDNFFDSGSGDNKSIAKEELMYIGEELLKESIFKHATVNDVYYDFSYSQGSGAVLGFDYEGDNFALDFPEIKEDIIEEFASNRKWRESYSLEEDDVQEILNVLKTKELNDLFDINFIVEHTSRYANFKINYEIYCCANQNIRYSLEELVEDWIYQNLMKNSEAVDELQSDFSSKAYDWYNDMRNIENYNDGTFDAYYYSNGTFAGYEEDFE